MKSNEENQILIKDTPILKPTEDLLFRGIFVDSIATSIKNYKDNESLTIGLYGKWGEGKTSIINLLIENLDKDEDIIYLRFEPWLYSNTEQLISMFFKDLSKNIDKKGNLKKLAKFFSDYAEVFEALSNFPEPTGMAKFGFKILGFTARKLPHKKTLSELKADIENYIKTLDKKILVVIDDIDRLNNSEIQQIFQLVKMLGNFPNTIYLLSMDDEIVANSLQEVQKYDGYKYLEKIVQVPLRLPLSGKKSIYNYVHKSLENILRDILKYEDEKKYFDSLIDYNFSIFFENLRDVNRYLNIFKFKLNALIHKVNATDLAVLTAFELFEKDVFFWIKNNKDRLYAYDKDFKDVIELFKNKDKEYLGKLLYKLFPKKQEQPIDMERIIKREKYFEAYFCFTIDNKIYNKDLEFFLENIKNKEQLINELNYDLTYKNGQNIGRLIEEILLHPKTAITDEKKQFIFDAFMYIGDDILRNVKLKYDGNNVKENLLALFNDFINILSLNDKDKKYEIILNSFDDKSDSLNIYAEYVDSLCNISPRHITGLISVFDINITMKNNLKNKLKDRIEEFYLSWKILDVPYLSDILEIWKVLDEEKYNKFIEEVKQDDEKLLKFVRAFIYLSFDESVNGIKKIKKDSISKYIDFEYIENSDIFNEISEFFR